MAVNTLKPIAPPPPKGNKPKPVPVQKPVAPPPVPRKKGFSIFKLLEKSLNVDHFFEKGLPVEYLPYVLFSTVIVLFYIANSHYAEKTVRKIDRTKSETEDLRADFTTLKAEYMYASKQSEVAKNVTAYGLIESSTPPVQVFVNPEEDEH